MVTQPCISQSRVYILISTGHCKLIEEKNPAEKCLCFYKGCKFCLHDQGKIQVKISVNDVIVVPDTHIASYL